MFNHPQKLCDQRATPQAAQSKVVVVLGMHRTGTSLCMEVLRELGVQLDADLISANEHNERGFFESRKIMELNEQICRVLGITWHTLFPRQLSEGWVDSDAVRPLRQQLSCLLAERNRLQCGLWGFKDPRLCLLLPLYKRVFAELELEPRYVVCTRNPAAVAASLKQRNGFPGILSELLWMDHTMRAIDGAGTELKAIVHYERWFGNPCLEAQRLAAALELEAGNYDGSQEASLEKLVDRELDHSGDNAGHFALESTGKIYELLLDGRNEEATAEVLEVQRGLELGLFPLLVLRQLFWRTSQQNYFCEANSCSVFTNNEPRPQVVRFDIPTQTQQLTGLRLDPSDSPGSAHFCSIKLFNFEDHVIWEWNGDGGAIREWETSDVTFAPQVEACGATAYFLTGEPLLMLPFQELRLDGAWTGGAVEFEFAPELLTCEPCRGKASNDLVFRKPSPAVKGTDAAKLKVACQVFWRTADLDYFTETNSCSAHTDIGPEMKVMRMAIPPTIQKITGLRLDPSDRSGLARLEWVRLLNIDGESVWNWDGTPSTILKWQAFNLTLLSQLGKQAVFAHFHSEDPNLILPVPTAQLNLISGRGGTVELCLEWIGINNSLPSLEHETE